MNALPGTQLKPAVRLQIAVAALVIVFVFGTLGFMVIERWSLMDAAYMTMITLSTIGYGEVRPLDTVGRLFDMVLIVVGVATGLYALGTIAEGVIEQHIFNDIVRERRMAREVDKLHDHFIVCGYGRVGMHVAMELAREGKDFVVIERDAELVEQCRAAGHHIVQGDATQDAILLKAGVERAKGVITALDSDAANLYITLSCRSLRGDLYIVARSSDESVEPKFVRAGANRVLCPYTLTGRRLAEMVITPEITNIIEVIGRHRHLELYMEEVTIHSGGPLAGRQMGDAMIRVETGAAIVAVKHDDDTMLANPAPQTLIKPGDTLVALGTREQLRRFRALSGESLSAAMAVSDETR